MKLSEMNQENLKKYNSLKQSFFVRKESLAPWAKMGDKAKYFGPMSYNAKGDYCYLLTTDHFYRPLGYNHPLYSEDAKRNLFEQINLKKVALFDEIADKPIGLQIYKSLEHFGDKISFALVPENEFYRNRFQYISVESHVNKALAFFDLSVFRSIDKLFYLKELLIQEKEIVVECDQNYFCHITFKKNKPVAPECLLPFQMLRLYLGSNLCVRTKSKIKQISELLSTFSVNQIDDLSFILDQDQETNKVIGSSLKGQNYIFLPLMTVEEEVIQIMEILKIETR